MSAKNERITPVACDLGNDSVKLIVNGNYHYVNTILKRNPGPRRIMGSGDKGDPKKYLDVTVDINGEKHIMGNYHVGELAQFGSNLESIGGFKCDSEMLHVCMMTSIAYGLVTEFPEETNFKIALGTGLPVNEFFFQNAEGQYDFAKVKTFRKRIVGTHKVKFNTSLLGNKEVTIEISKDRLSLLPEGYAALLKILFNEDGTSKYPEYTRKNAIAFALDVGSGTFDVSAIMNQDYFEPAFFGDKIGMSKALTALCGIVQNKTNVDDITRFEINEHLFDEELKGIYSTSKVTVDLNKEKIEPYRFLASELADNFKKGLAERQININRVTALFLIGGGSMELSEYIKETLGSDIQNIIKAENARTANVDGYWDSINKLLKGVA